MNKQIFVDGASLHHMGIALGIKRIDYAALMRVLTQIGTVGRRVNCSAWFSLPNNLKHASFAKNLRTVGFEVVFGDSRRGEDDKVLIERMRTMTKEDTREIILVSADQDYVEVLREKKPQGIRVFVVSSKTASLDDTLKIAKHYQNVLETEFTFVDLAAWRGVIALEMLEQTQTYFSAVLESDERHPDRQNELLRELQELTKRFPGSRIRRVR